LEGWDLLRKIRRILLIKNRDEFCGANPNEKVLETIETLSFTLLQPLKSEA